MSNCYFADDKFDCVIRELLSRGWTRSDSMKGVGLLWTNLKNIEWDSVEGEQFVSHMRGSQHLSNKAFLAYHMDTSGARCMMPEQWSSAYQDLAALLGIAVLSDLYSCSRLLLSLVCHEQEHEQEGDVVRESSMQLEVLEKQSRDVLRVLNTDQEWSVSDQGHLANSLLSALGRATTAMKMKEGGSHQEVIFLNELASLVSSLEERESSFRRCGGTRGIWIIKPVGSSCGENILVVRGLKDMLRTVQERDYKCIVQKYIERPLLVRQGRKFDIRQWVLVTSIDPLVVYGFTEFYCRLSARSFELSSPGLLDPTVHLTNHAIQKFVVGGGESDGKSSGGGEKADVSEAEVESYCDTMMTHAQFKQEVDGGCCGEASLLESIIMPQIKRIAVQTVASVRDKLEKVGKGFEWLGLDLMITADNQVLLVECNVSPDISPSTSVTARLVDAGVKDLFALLLDGRAEPPITRTPFWDLWYPSQTIDFSFLNLQGGVLSFARKKRDASMLGKDYTPKKEHLAQRVATLLAEQGSAQENKEAAEGGEEEEEEDEI